MALELDGVSEKIVSATFRLIQNDGIEKATTKKIAAEAGVNEVTIFRKFKNKNNLVEITKEYYLQKLIRKLEEIFIFDEDDEIEEYLKICFFGILNLSDDDFGIIKIAMEEVRDVSDGALLISEVTDLILDKLEEFFKFQIGNGTVREDINVKSLAVMCFSVLFQSVILWKIYHQNLGFDSSPYGDNIMKILYEGITP